MGTDGLFDNLYDPDIEKCLYPSVKPQGSGPNATFKLEGAESVAKCMANKAYDLSKDQRYMSPFARGAL